MLCSPIINFRCGSNPTFALQPFHGGGHFRRTGRGGLIRYLVPRLSRGAVAELEQLQGLLERIVLTKDDDRRTSPLLDQVGELKAGPVYKAIMTATGNQPCDFSKFVRGNGNRAPPLVQFFAWLLVQKRIQCRANLHMKAVLDDPSCELCAHAVEDCDRIILLCPFAAQVWSSLGVCTAGCDVSQLWLLPRPPGIPVKHYNVFILLIAWHLWKHRNDVVFNAATPSLARFWATCKEEARLWSCRWRRDGRVEVEFWCQLFSSM